MLGEVAQHLDGERVVVGLERGVAGVGDDVGPGGAPASPSTGGGLVRGDGALLDEDVEVAAHRGGRQVEVATELGGRDRAVGGDVLEHPRARAGLEVGDAVALPCLAHRALTEKHHIIMS